MRPAVRDLVSKDHALRPRPVEGNPPESGSGQSTPRGLVLQQATWPSSQAAVSEALDDAYGPFYGVFSAGRATGVRWSAKAVVSAYSAISMANQVRVGPDVERKPAECQTESSKTSPALTARAALLRI
jgi:hypothetical protein